MKAKPATLAAYARKATKENSVEAEIRALLELNNWRVFKTDVMRGVTVDYGEKGTRKFTEGTPGQPDLLAVRASPANVLGADSYDVLFIETKRPVGGRLSTEQKTWHQIARRDGYIVIVARSWDELVAKAAKEGVRVQR